ncbi:MAG: hypothetical protein KTR25_02910, partial [Myxococcales bacterium]|nr:hypothetical protein [Myxococcales bacterium]
EDDQVPPQGEALIDAWLAEGVYQQWACEDEPDLGRVEGPHGVNRVCSNDVIAQDTEGVAPWPAGAAAVKELYDEAGENLLGRIVYLKTKNYSASGANWYWYAKSGDVLGVDGLDVAGCTGCHVNAPRDLTYITVPAALE